MRRALGVALAGVALTLVALTFDATPLLVPGLAFVALGVGAPAWVWASSRQLHIARTLHDDRVVEGEPLEATIAVQRGPIGVPGAELHDPLSRDYVSLSAPLSLIRGARTAQVRIVTRFARRGLRRLAPPTMLVRDPLGLAEAELPGSGPVQEVLVLPRTERVRWGLHGYGTPPQRSEGRTLAEPMAAVDVDGLRPYQLGTPASRIHWPALARGAGLLERRLRADRDTRPLVVLDARGAGSDEQLDAAVRAAASLALELARSGGARLLLPGDRRALAIEPDLGQWAAAHARLALVESGPRTKPPLVDAMTRQGPIFYVAVQPLDRLPTSLSTPGRGTVAVVLPKEIAADGLGRASFEVTGCRGYVVRSRAARGRGLAPEAAGAGVRA